MPQSSEEKPMDSMFELWCDLPNEMRAECIKRMDFKSRMRLRSASKQDKLLVEAAPKYKFDSVIVELDVEYIPSVVCTKTDDSEVKKKNRGKTTPEFLEKAHQLIVQILKFTRTDNFEFASKFTTDEAVSKFLADISDYTPFRFKTITLDCGKFEIIDFFLKNCNSLESIELGRCDNEIDEARMIEIINISTVINTKTVKMIDLKSPEIPYQLITKWLENKDLELGKVLQIRIDSLITFLAEKLENRVISKTSELLRISTNDTAKHILIRSIPDQEGYFSFLVIPSNQKESEYEKNDKWAKEHSQKQTSKCMTQINLAMFNFSPEYLENIINELSVEDYEPDAEDYEGYYDDFF